MKSGVILAISAVANVVLAGCVIALLQHRPVVAPPSPQVVTETVTNVVVRGGVKRLEATNLSSLITNVWKAIESPDYRRYIAGMRAIGCPEETIRDIIITDLNKLYAQKARALSPAKDYRFWQPDPSQDDPKAREFQRQVAQLEKEKRDTVRALLGVDYQVEMAKQSVVPNYQERQLGFLPDSKRQQLQALADKYTEQEQAIYDQAANGELSAAQKEALQEIRDKRRAEIAGMLTPAELAEYDMRTSTNAQDLRHRMGAFDGTESDFRNLYKVQKSYEDQLKAYEAAGTLTPEVKAALQSAKEQELKTLLGDRYAEYQRTQDASYRELYQAGQQNNLPKETIQAVYDMKRAAEEQHRLLLANEALTDEQKAAGAAALRAETERAIKDALGEKAFQEYQKRGGNWLSNLGETGKK